MIEISLNEYNNFLESLKKPRATISCLVRDILIILCGNCAVDDSAINVLAMWIRRKYPLSSTLFKDSQANCRERPMERLHSYPDYIIIKTEMWSILGSEINPDKMTIEQMKLIMKKYGNPKNPAENKWTYLSTNFKGLPLNCDNSNLEARKRCKLYTCEEQNENSDCNVITSDYKLKNIKISRVNEINDLGVTFDSKLNFKLHTNNIIKKSSSKLGFIKRTCKDFHDAHALKLLYFSLVRSQLEYANLIWHTNSITQNKDLSQIQNNFLRFLSFQCHIYRAPHSDYNIINRLFSILPFEKRFTQLNLKFLYKLLHNIIDCPELVERLCFKINPLNSRQKQLFYPPNISSKYIYLSAQAAPVVESNEVIETQTKKVVNHTDAAPVVESNEVIETQTKKIVNHTDAPAVVEPDDLPFSIGSPVNVTTIGYSYYAAIVDSIDDKYVTVKFPFTKDTKCHKYHIKDVKPFKPQYYDKNHKYLFVIKWSIRKI
ncbi:hypothetical protein AGLY_011963 [Aphis glycines]|uniref:Uncharacterized protein n=1 Tax=Aphis glycines TaxID=307491 RepID=A0A6G0TCL3_APHGL|nr:hypothetical protein AGLY_011963 [Aphis glycines]